MAYLMENSGVISLNVCAACRKGFQMTAPISCGFASLSSSAMDSAPSSPSCRGTMRNLSDSAASVHQTWAVSGRSSCQRPADDCRAPASSRDKDAGTWWLSSRTC